MIVSLIIIRYTLQQLHVNIRIVCLITFVLSLTGSLILTDWQSLRGRDPCTQLEPPTVINDTRVLSAAVIGRNCYYIDVSSSVDINATVSPIVLSCVNSCVDHTTCDLLQNLSIVEETSNDSMTINCLWKEDESRVYLSCYKPFSKQFIELLPDQLLTDYYYSYEAGSSGDHDMNSTSCPSVSPRFPEEDQFVLSLHSHQQLDCESMSHLSGSFSLSQWAECEATTNDSSQCICEGSSSEEQCFWNPSSRISDTYCERCRPVCLSKDHSLSFPQLIIGAFVLALGYPMGRMTLTILASDGLGEASQVSHTFTLLGIYIYIIIIIILSTINVGPCDGRTGRCRIPGSLRWSNLGLVYNEL